MHEQDEKQDTAWELLKKARPVEVEPFFAKETRRIAAATPQGLPAGILAWFGFSGKRTGTDAGSAPINGSRFALAGVAVGVFVAAALAIALLRQDEEGGTRIAGTTNPALLDPSTEKLSPQALDALPEELAKVPEVASLEREFNEIAQLLHLTSTRDVSSLGDDEIETLLF